MAVPLAVAQCTVVVAPVTADCVTVNANAVVTPEGPSALATLAIDSVGAGSSLTIVAVPLGVAIVALTGVERLTLNVSSTSYRASPTSLTVNVPVVAPTAIVTLPDVAA